MHTRYATLWIGLALASLPLALGGHLSLAQTADATAAPPPAATASASSLLTHTPPQDPNALTLADCYRLALKRSEDVAIRQEEIDAHLGRFLQALSGVLPRASFVMSRKRQDGGGQSAFTLRDVPEDKFTFSQPLFAGFKSVATLLGSRADRRQRQANLAWAQQLLLIDVSDAFYLLSEHQQDRETLASIVETLRGRMDELRQRQQLGRSRASEAVSAEAQLARVEAELERVRASETTARQLLEFLTGLDHVEAIADREPSVPLLADAETCAEQSSERPDVRAARDAWDVARKTVGVTQARLWPTVDLDGNYYTQRAGIAADVDWDVTLNVEVPLFQGGGAVGAVQEALSKARQEQLRYERVRRAAELDIRETHARLQSSVAQTAALEKAMLAAGRNFDAQMEDYRLSLVNNLEVLQALQDLESIRRDFLHAQQETKRLAWYLRAATGETP